VKHQYVERHRKGDHVCYISDLAKFKAHYPQWRLTRFIGDIIDEMIAAERERAGAAHA
jgi:CDP-paratose 2-epimerase